MQVMLKPRALILLGICLLSSGLTAPAAVTAGKGAPASAGARDSDWLLSPELLDHAGLKAVWQQTLPMKKGETFAVVTLLGDRLYLRSDRNYMWSLNAVAGDVVFSRSVAPQGIPVLGLISYGDRFISVVGNQLTECSAVTGTEERVADLELSIVTPPVRNNQFYYVAAGDRRLHVLRAQDLVRIFKVAADNESLITTVLADDNVVVFGTSAGNVVGMMADAPKKLWQFDAAEAIAGPIIRDGNSLYFASKDTNVYRVDMTGATGASMAWKFQTEAVLERAPRVTQGYVYQYAPGRGLTAIDKRTGQAVWSVPEGLDLLAEVELKAYLITKVRTLVVMDNATGKRVYSINSAPVVAHISNTENARIYIADEHGRIACLTPTR
ncbi:MAG: PQQ-binding-like beta-propeller repeat protein [Phycisphaerales bacterium]